MGGEKASKKSPCFDDGHYCILSRLVFVSDYLLQDIDNLINFSRFVKNLSYSCVSYLFEQSWVCNNSESDNRNLGFNFFHLPSYFYTGLSTIIQFLLIHIVCR